LGGGLGKDERRDEVEEEEESVRSERDEKSDEIKVPP
jgi:hypothetical protein